MDRAKATFQEVISVEMDVQIFGRNAAEFLCLCVCTQVLFVPNICRE